jgi:hypothetical protein
MLPAMESNRNTAADALRRSARRLVLVSVLLGAHLGLARDWSRRNS